MPPGATPYCAESTSSAAIPCAKMSNPMAVIAPMLLDNRASVISASSLIV